MLIIFVLTALLVGLFAGFVIGVKLSKMNLENEQQNNENEQQSE